MIANSFHFDSKLYNLNLLTFVSFSIFEIKQNLIYVKNKCHSKTKIVFLRQHNGIIITIVRKIILKNILHNTKEYAAD